MILEELLLGLRKTAQSVKGLLHEPGALSLDPQNSPKKPSRVAYICSPGAGKETGGSLGLAGQTVSLSQRAPGSVSDSVSKNRWRAVEV